MKAHAGIYATAAQEAYLDRLWIEVGRYGTAEWARSSRRMLRREASREIDMLRAAIQRGKAADGCRECASAWSQEGRS